MRAAAAPTLASQLRRLPISVTPGQDGYRLAFIGGPDFDTIDSFHTLEAAVAARQSAIIAVGKLDAIFRGREAA